MANVPKAIHHPKHCRDAGDRVIEGSCAVCRKCWIFVGGGARHGRCVYGGPYRGYAELEPINVAVDKNVSRETDACESSCTDSAPSGPGAISPNQI